MRWSRTLTVAALVLVALGPRGGAVEPMPWGAYVTAVEAYEMKTARPDGVLLVDVRDPIEIMFTGFSPVVDVNVPFQFADPTRWNERSSAFVMARNPAFADGIAAALTARGLEESAPVILMCRSGGTRGGPAAEVLQARGFSEVYVVSDGFQGDTARDHPNGPLRIENGWQNSGLPWGWRLDREKIHGRAE
jgi:rhodanese-related sulfurtransferase